MTGKIVRTPNVGEDAKKYGTVTIKINNSFIKLISITRRNEVICGDAVPQL